MTKDGWRDAILKCVEQHNQGDDEFLDGMAEMIAEFDMAKELLRRVGFGVTGTPILRVIQEVKEYRESQDSFLEAIRIR